MPPQQRSARMFSQLRNAKQGPDQTVTSFVAYINGLACKTNISDATKCMFLLTGLRSGVCSMMPRSVTYEAFDAMVDATIRAENDLQFKAECARLWSNREKVADKSAAKHKQQQQQQQNYLSAGHGARGTDRLRCGQGGFRGFRCCGQGRGRGNSKLRGDHAGSSSGAASHGRGERL
jgi:hypothetical protein